MHDRASVEFDQGGILRFMDSDLSRAGRREHLANFNPLTDHFLQGIQDLAVAVVVLSSHIRHLSFEGTSRVSIEAWETQYDALSKKFAELKTIADHVSTPQNE